MLIPLYPRGLPASPETSSILEELLVLAGVDVSRSIEPPMSEVEFNPGCRPSDEVLLDRFTPHARCSVRHLTEETILVLPWRIRADHELKRTLTWLASQLNFRIKTGQQARHVLVVEDHEAAMDFEDYAKRDGSVLGKLHQGGIWCTDYGRFFLVSWQSTVPRKVLASRLKNLLTSDRSFPSDEKERPSVLPEPSEAPVSKRVTGQISRIPGQPSRRPSSISFRAVTDRRSPTEPPDSDRASLKRRP